MQEAKPVVLTKPARGREMLVKKPQTEIGSIEKETANNQNTETFYEGYVDGQLFLVPDSNLEAMKDMINFRMRPKTSIRYKHQTSYDIQYYDQFTEKLNELLTKIDVFQESGDFQRPNHISENTDQNDEEKQEESADKLANKDDVSNKSTKSGEFHNIEQVKSELIGVLEKSVIIKELESSTSSDISEPPAEALVPNDPDELRFKFLISGHFKDGEKPIYIVQEHDEKNDIFKDQNLDFISSQEVENTNVFISGKLYSENILVESKGKPSFLNTKPNKIMIDEEKSKTFIESFEHVFEKEDCCILLKGDFIKGTNGKITPSLSFGVKEKKSSDS